MTTTTAVAIIPFSDLERMGNAIAKSGLFGIKTPEQAIALMLVAQSEGLHPAIAARDYHIISGRPALKSDAMLARFQMAGGKVEWHDYTSEKVSATFTHPQGGSVRVEWDTNRSKLAGIYKDMHIKYPRQMLRARTISEGVRTVFPGCIGGFYAPEEITDLPPEKEKEVQGEVVTPEKPAAQPKKKSLGVDALKAKLSAEQSPQSQQSPQSPQSPPQSQPEAPTEAPKQPAMATSTSPAMAAIQAMPDDLGPVMGDENVTLTPEKKITPEWVKNLNDICNQNGIAPFRLLRAAKVDKLADINDVDLPRALDWLDKIITAQDAKLAAQRADKAVEGEQL